MRAQRRALTPEERERASKVICAKLIYDGNISVAVDPFEGGGAVAVYLATPDEIDLSDFIREMLDRGVKVVAPRWNGKTYKLVRLKSLSEGDLRRGPMGILEPKASRIVKPSKVAAWIVPGLAFTIHGDRLGYGGGWYDRLMSNAKGFKIGVAHEFQIVENLPREPHDIQLIRIVTDNLSDKHVEFTETADGFRASASIGAQTLRRVLFMLSLLGFGMFPIMLWLPFGFSHGTIAMPMWILIAALVAMTAAILASAITLLYIVGGPVTAEIEVKGEQGVCRRRFLGLIPHRAIHFRWSPWSKAIPYGHYSLYSAPGKTMLSIVEGNVERCLFRTYEDTAAELAILMNLSHHVNPEDMDASANAILASLPPGMRIVCDGAAETMEVKVHSLTGLSRAIRLCLMLGVIGTLLATFMARWPIVFVLSLLLLWGAISLVVVYNALWTLFGRHRLTIAGANCEYEARLGPRVKRLSFVINGDSHATAEYPSSSLCVTNAGGDHHYCFNDLPPRCYLPLIAFVRHCSSKNQ